MSHRTRERPGSSLVEVSRERIQLQVSAWTPCRAQASSASVTHERLSVRASVLSPERTTVVIATTTPGTHMPSWAVSMVQIRANPGGPNSRVQQAATKKRGGRCGSRSMG